jgi:hypothetical protein
MFCQKIRIFVKLLTYFFTVLKKKTVLFTKQ